MKYLPWKELHKHFEALYGPRIDVLERLSKAAFFHMVTCVFKITDFGALLGVVLGLFRPVPKRTCKGSEITKYKSLTDLRHLETKGNK